MLVRGLGARLGLGVERLVALRLRDGPGLELMPGFRVLKRLLALGRAAPAQGRSRATQSAEDGGERRLVLPCELSAGGALLVLPAELLGLCVTELRRRAAASRAASGATYPPRTVAWDSHRSLQCASDAGETMLQHLVTLREALDLLGQLAKNPLQIRQSRFSCLSPAALLTSATTLRPQFPPRLASFEPLEHLVRS